MIWLKTNILSHQSQEIEIRSLRRALAMGSSKKMDPLNEYDQENEPEAEQDDQVSKANQNN